jgi:hypothetical protein
MAARLDHELDVELFRRVIAPLCSKRTKFADACN